MCVCVCVCVCECMCVQCMCVRVCICLLQFSVLQTLLTHPLVHTSTEESGCTPRLQSHHLPHGCTVNDQPQVEQAVCSNRECTCDPDLSAHVCCCRSLKHEPFTNIVCPEGVATPTVTNTTECGCGSCDDLSIQVHVTITNRDTNEAIPAALVLRVEDGPDSVNYLGLTSKHGQLMFTESIGRQYLEIKVLAAGYVPYMTMPMKLHPHKRVLRVGVVMIPSMNMDVGLGGSEIILRLGAIASVSAPAGECVCVWVGGWVCMCVCVCVGVWVWVRMCVSLSCSSR